MMYFTKKIMDLASSAESRLKDVFDKIEYTAQQNQYRVMRAYSENRVSYSHFFGSTGYGYNDRGREVFDRIVADVFGAPAAIARHNFVSGTHALTVALFSVLRPSDTLLSVTGKPYDTLDQVIGISGDDGGSLREFGVIYRQLDLRDNGIDYDALEKELLSAPKVIFAQRSRGYSQRLPLSVEQMNTLYAFVKEHSPGSLVIIDNCYGEFVLEAEPTADLLVGSFIKNPGGGLADTGGYIAGSEKCVSLAANRLTSPGTGSEVGPTLDQTRRLFQGFFMAPHTVAQALKTAAFAAAVLSECGICVSPGVSDRRLDIVQSIHFGDRAKLIAFCEGIQAGSPIDSNAVPVPWDMPGYDSPVIMAAGTFTQGASIELSADAPIREPYTLYLQGGLTYESGKYGILTALSRII